MKKITLLFLLVSFNFFGQWTNTPQTANAIATGSDQQLFGGAYGSPHSVIVDNDQNIITAFKNTTLSTRGIYLQKIDAGGNKLWGNTGRLIYDGAYLHNGITRYTGADDIQVVADGAGGVIIAFLGKDISRAYYDPKEIMAIRIDGNGNNVWSGRISLSAPSYVDGIPGDFRIIADGNGGAYAGWISRYYSNTDDPQTAFKLFYQHLNADGTIAFPQGKLLKNLNSTWPNNSDITYYPIIEKTPSGNIIFSWKDFNPATNNWGLFCNMINPQGNSLWTDDVLVDSGILPTDPGRPTDYYPHLLGTTNNGVFVMYTKSYNLKRIGFIRNNGSIAFSGIEVTNTADYFLYHEFDITTTPNGDAMIVYRGGNRQAYIQKFSQDGQKMFGYYGKLISVTGLEYSHVYYTKIIRTSDNNYLTTFSGIFLGTTDFKIMASLNDENGSLLFPVGGTVLLHNRAGNPNLLPTNYRGAVLIGTADLENGNLDDILAFQILPSHNPIELSLKNGTSSMTMTTEDNLNFNIENYTHTATGPLSFSKYGITNLYFPAMPTGTATMDASRSSASLPAGVYDLNYNAMTNYYEFSSTLSTGDKHLKAVSFYPNPAADKLYFSKPLQQVTIFDVLGNKVLEAEGPTEYAFVENFSSGIYLLKAENADGQTISMKFIKK